MAAEKEKEEEKDKMDEAKIESIKRKGRRSEQLLLRVKAEDEAVVRVISHMFDLELTEVAPGIDIEKDIIAQMDFKPIINNPRTMAQNAHV